MKYKRAIIDRLQDSIKIDLDTWCWVWQHCTKRKGYGQIRISGKYRTVHVVSYEEFIGSVPEGLELDHTCRNRACINPDHLEAITHKANVHRGRTIAAINASKPCCPQGHAYDLQNTRMYKDMRYCRACHRINSLAAYHKKRQK